MSSCSKENQSATDNLKQADIKAVPTLKLYKSLRDSLSPPVENSSLSSRMKRRTQVHKSLDFSLTKCLVSASRYIKASHEIGSFHAPPSTTTRKSSNHCEVIIKNRHVSRNLLLDHFPA